MELSDLIISKYCLIRNRRIVLNGQNLIEEETDSDLAQFLSSVYKTFGAEYPKFYKMDYLSKLGFLTAEFLTDFGSNVKDYKDDEIAIILSNSQSSLETDGRFLETIADEEKFYPNPSLFVYTLPNILIGEMSIKYKMKGESVFFISQQIDFELLKTYCSSIFENTKSKSIITGWVDLDSKHNYESILYLIEDKSATQADSEVWSFSVRDMEDLYFEKNLEEVE